MAGYRGYTISNSYALRLEKHSGMLHPEYYDTQEQAILAMNILKNVYGSCLLMHGYKITSVTHPGSLLKGSQEFYERHEDAMNDLKEHTDRERYTSSLRPEVIALLREQFPVGTRVECIEMYDAYTDIPKGTQGNVTGVDDIGTIHVQWDTGPSLGLVFGEDKYKVVK